MHAFDPSPYLAISTIDAVRVVRVGLSMNRFARMARSPVVSGQS
jgi:hypothetical protein